MPTPRLLFAMPMAAALLTPLAGCTEIATAERPKPPEPTVEKTLGIDELVINRLFEQLDAFRGPRGRWHARTGFDDGFIRVVARNLPPCSRPAARDRLRIEDDQVKTFVYSLTRNAADPRMVLAQQVTRYPSAGDAALWVDDFENAGYVCEEVDGRPAGQVERRRPVTLNDPALFPDPDTAGVSAAEYAFNDTSLAGSTSVVVTRERNLVAVSVGYHPDASLGVEGTHAQQRTYRQLKAFTLRRAVRLARDLRAS